MNPAAMQEAIRTLQVDYPESDGKPMAETDVHRQEMMDLIQMLTDHFADDPTVYISGNLFVYYEEGKPDKVVAPDVFVVKGLDKGLRRTYKLWVEQRVPCTVIEISSRKTAREDRREKYDLYAQLGVPEYFLFDPLGEYLRPPLYGLRLVGKAYQLIGPGADGSVLSTELGLRLQRHGRHLSLVDAATGERLLRPAEQRARAEEQARLAAEQRVARLAA
ncbi:MAG: Uma2 family endonuclease, partial [Chloroflexaceae bacterium]|nr:Uma2 family endonuclease [Chloroflexaceae bacterium]